MKDLRCFFVSILRAWIIASIIILIAYCLWSLDRGLDLTDESYYLAAAIHPDAVLLWATAMHWMTSPLWNISGNLVGFRCVGLIILAISAIVIGLGTSRVFARTLSASSLQTVQAQFLVAGSLAAALLYHSFMPFTPSYNLLAVSGAYLGLGLICYSANAENAANRRVLDCAVGIALGIAFLAKFSTGVIAWLLVCGLSLVFHQNLRQGIYGILTLSLAMLAVLTIFVVSHGTFAEALSQFKMGTQVYMLGADETFSVRLLRYCRETWTFLRLIASDFTIPLLAFGFYVFRPERWMLLIGLAVFGYSVITHGYLLGGMDKYQQQAAPLLIAVLLSLSIMPKIWWRHRQSRSLLAALFLLPCGIAIGSFNPIHVQVLFSMAPWGIIVALQAIPANAAISLKCENLLIVALFIFIVSAQTISNGFRAPYRQHRPLSEQNELIEFPLLGSVRVDRDSREGYLQLQQLAKQCAIAAGSPFIGLYNIPGVALILQTVPVGMPLLQDRVSTEPILDQLSSQQLKSAVIGIDRDTESFDSGMPRQLAQFPDGYRWCGTVTLPFQNQKLELWVDAAH